MAYDEKLADRIRDLLAPTAEVTEKKMFGGLAFLVGGRMSVAVSGQGGLLARVAPGDTEQLLAGDGVEPMVMRGKEMRGWLRVDDDHVRTKRQLERWVDRGVAAALAAG